MKFRYELGDYVKVGNTLEGVVIRREWERQPPHWGMQARYEIRLPHRAILSRVYENEISLHTDLADRDVQAYNEDSNEGD